MNYTLQIDLVGADKSEAMLDKLQKSVGSLGSTPKISFDKWLTSGVGEDAGEKMGESIAKGTKKKLSSFNILDAWGKSAFKGLNDFWNNAVKVGTSGNSGAGTIRKPPILPLPGKMDMSKILTGSLVTLLGNDYIGARVLSDELGKRKGGVGGVAGGLFGAAGITGFSEIIAAIKIFKFAVHTFEGVAKIMNAAIEKGFGLYTQAAQQGLNTKFFTQRETLAKVLGVSNPNDVFRFGAAVQYVQERTRDANDVLSKTAKPLAQLSVETRILETDFSALAAKITGDLAPAINLFIRTIDLLVKSISFGTDVIKANLKAGVAGYVTSSLPLSIISKLLGPVIGAVYKESQMPDLIGGMKQLPASHWEHMGLAIGGAGNTTNDLIRKSNVYLKTIAEVMKGHASPGSNRFGMSPLVGNP